MGDRTKAGFRAGFALWQQTRQHLVSDQALTTAAEHYARRFGTPQTNAYKTALSGWWGGYRLAEELDDHVYLGGTLPVRRTCPAHGCSVELSQDRLACHRHWYALPDVLRRSLTAALVRGDKPTRTRLIRHAMRYWKTQALESAVKGR